MLLLRFDGHIFPHSFHAHLVSYSQTCRRMRRAFRLELGAIFARLPVLAGHVGRPVALPQAHSETGSVADPFLHVGQSGVGPER